MPLDDVSIEILRKREFLDKNGAVDRKKIAEVLIKDLVENYMVDSDASDVIKAKSARIERLVSDHFREATPALVDLMRDLTSTGYSGPVQRLLNGNGTLCGTKIRERVTSTHPDGTVTEKIVPVPVRFVTKNFEVVKAYVIEGGVQRKIDSLASSTDKTIAMVRERFPEESKYLDKVLRPELSTRFRQGIKVLEVKVSK